MVWNCCGGGLVWSGTVVVVGWCGLELFVCGGGLVWSGTVLVVGWCGLELFVVVG